MRAPHEVFVLQMPQISEELSPTEASTHVSTLPVQLGDEGVGAGEDGAGAGEDGATGEPGGAGEDGDGQGELAGGRIPSGSSMPHSAGALQSSPAMYFLLKF